VIIPNSQLTAKQVTNWTLTDQRRRLDLAVSVCPGSQPHQAIELLEGVALAHPMVLHDPPPRCLFLSYSENAIDFELRVWADYDIATDVRSGLMTAVYEAVYAAGMGFPDSPREVLLVNEGCSMRLKPSEA
jgi:small-conductance mechanosensitive channel